MTAHMRPQRTRNKFAREERERKAFEAQVRKELAAKRTPEEQLARLDAGGFVAAKERAKLAPTDGLQKGDTTVLIAPVKPKKGKR